MQQRPSPIRKAMSPNHSVLLPSPHTELRQQVQSQLTRARTSHHMRLSPLRMGRSNGTQ